MNTCQTLHVMKNIWNRILRRKPKPSFLAYSIVGFTNESWLNGVIRQGRLYDYLFHWHFGKVLLWFFLKLKHKLKNKK